MKCPHCLKEAELKVLESRRVDDAVWRLRTCRNCFKTFTSREVTSLDLRMPYSTLMRQRKTDKPAPVKPEPEQRAITSTAAHLQGVWR